MTSLYVDRRGVSAKVDGEAIAFYEKDQRRGTVPIAPLKRVFFRGDAMVSTALLGKLGEAGIGVIILSGRKAEPTLMLARPHNDAARRVAQYRLSLDADFRLRFTRSLVHKKLLAQAGYLDEIAQRAMLSRHEIVREAGHLRAAVPRIGEQGGVDALRGLEGAAAAHYFAGLAAYMPDSLRFRGRNRRPPRDPLNVLLSLGYTLLQSEAVVALYGAGLDPFIGFFHALDFGRESLACDVIEPLRPQIDKFCVELFKDRKLRPEHFSMSAGACLMGKTARTIFYPEYEAFAEGLRKSVDDAVTELVDEVRRSIPEKEFEEELD
ncbi:MAG: CRISPR-associated endonuclease Cas1 [Duodenibacillus sp.]|nr:CRISPR-associated endonuclease Cas1 [Duodenibacillus sp.]